MVVSEHLSLPKEEEGLAIQELERFYRHLGKRQLLLLA